MKPEIRINAVKQWYPSPATRQLWRIQDRIERHILSAPEREACRLSEWWEKYKTESFRRHTIPESAVKDFVIEKNCGQR
jgi:hypothetical protein